jgi:hypothetical protein
MVTKLWKAITICFLMACAVCPSFGQATNARLGGVVTDASGAIVPGAKVTVKNTGTSLVEVGTSGSDGVYQFPLLPAGAYTLKVEASGFQSYQQTGIVLTVNQPATLNVALKVGEASETVTVTGGTLQLDTTTAQIGQTMTADEISDLPLNGRNPATLVFIAPGTTNEFYSQASTPVGEGLPNETSASSGGGRQGSDWYLLDGVSNNDMFGFEAAPFPNSDATAEFRTIVANYDARYGFAPSGTVIIETKSGSNKFHGGAFEFVRNNDLNASNYFSGNVDMLHRNQYGGYVGGPIWRNKLFFFTNYQRTKSTYNGATSTTYNPTTAMLNGDFSAVPQSDLDGPLAPQVFHTVNGKPNQVNPALFSPGALKIDAQIIPGQTPSTGFVTYSGPPTVQIYNENTSRLDYNINPQQRIFVRSFLYDYTNIGYSFPGNLQAAGNGTKGNYLNLAVGHTWTISPSFINSLTVSWQSLDVNTGSQVFDKSGNPLCLSEFIDVQDPPSTCYMGNVTAFDGNVLYGGGLGFAVGGNSPEYTHRRYFWLTDTVTKVAGKNTITAGFDLFRRYMYNDEIGQQLFNADFNGEFTGFPLADFLLGYLANYGQGAGLAGSTTGWMQGYYAQDQYQLKPNLTVLLGLRWEPFVPPVLAAGRGVDFIAGQQSTRYPNAPLGMVFPGDTGISSALFNSSYGYWMPRVSVAWQPKKDWSVRSGFGMYTMPMEDAFYRQAFSTAPFSPSFSMSASGNTPFSFDNPWSSFTATGGVSPFPPFASPSQVPPSSTTFLTPVDLAGVFNPHLKIGITEAWNLSIDHQFGKNWALHLGYVGSTSYHMATTVDLNPGQYAAGGARTTYPNFSTILQVQDGATGKYDALQISIDKRMSHNLQFHSNFTYSKTMDVGGSGDPSFESSVSDPYSIRHDYGRSSLNYPFIWTLNAVYTTPKWNVSNGILRTLVNGWEVSGVWTDQSGPPFTVNGGQGNNNSEFNEYQDRADVVPGQPFNIRKGGKSHWLNNYFNQAAFTNNAPGTPGDSEKFFIQEPPTAEADLAAVKNFSIMEKYKLQFRWEAFNAFNHPSFGQPDSNPGDSNFGQITGIGNVPPRVMQGALKFTF